MKQIYASFAYCFFSLLIISPTFSQTKTPYEKSSEERNKQEKLNNSDYLVTGIAIKMSFENWLKKGEFEKTIEYDKRIEKQGSSVFDSICFSEINKYKKYFDIQIQDYNADNEYFTVHLKYNNLSWEDKLAIPITEAKNFKSKFYLSKHLLSETRWLSLDDNFIPATVILIPFPDSKSYKFSTPINGIGEAIVYSTQGLSIDNQKTLGLEFNSKTTKQVIDKFKPENEDHIFTNVEVLPTFPGGIEQFSNFLSKNLRYPPVAIDAGIQGRVFCQFVVEKDGSLTDIKVVRGIGGGCDEEAVRVLKNSPKWNPGVQNGRNVRVSYTLPIFFQKAQ